MTHPEDTSPNGAQNEKNKSELEDSTTLDIGLDESKAELLKANGGDDHPENFKTAIIDPSTASDTGEFNGLGKDEVMQYANDPFWVKLRWVMFILFWVGWILMLVAAIAIIVLAPRCPDRADLKWYHTDTIYHVDAKSFKDSNGDGIGDFQGLKDKLDYITDSDDLDTQAIWLSGIYKADKFGGILDYKELDPSFAPDSAKFRSWVKKIRKEGKKVILDLLPYTSKDHPWFLKSISGEDGKKYSDYYVWSKEMDNTKTPNNWKMASGDSVWKYESTRKAWYLRSVDDAMPDLNLNNPAVLEEIKDVMKYWFDAGVSGFHIEGVEYLVENPDLVDNAVPDLSQNTHYNGTFTVLEELRKIADDFSDKPGRERVLLGTTGSANSTHVQAYWGSKDHERLHIVSPKVKLTKDINSDWVRNEMEHYLSDDIEEEQWLGWQFGDFSTSRIASRMDPADYKKQVVTVQAIQQLMPGTPLVVYGDEFAQRDGAGAEPDKFHAPMQWDKTKFAGFSSVDPWTPVSSYYALDNVKAGRLHFKDITPFQAYKQLIELRKEESFQFGKTKVCQSSAGVLIFSRHAHRFPYFVVVVSLQDGEYNVSPSDLECASPKEEATVRFHTRNKMVGDTINTEDFGLHLKGRDVVVLEFPAED